MATKDTIEIDVNVGEGVKSLTNLKAEFKSLQKQLDGLDESSQEYIETLQKLGGVKDDIGDLSTAINDFAGTDAKIGAINSVVGGIASGFQAATGAAALFGSQSEDVEKALLKVQSVMALTEGIKGLTAMQDSLKAAGNVAKSLVTQLIGVDAYTKIVTISTRIWNAVMAANPIMLMVAAITALVGAAVLLANAFDNSKDATEEYIEANNRAIEQSKETVKSIDNEITALSGLASNEKEIIALKRQRIIETQKQAELDAKNAAAQAEKDKELSWYQKIGVAVNELQGIEGTRAANVAKNTEESNKKLKESVDLAKKSAAELQAFDNEQQQKKIDAAKEAAQKAIEIEKQKNDDINKINQEAFEDWQKIRLAEQKAEEDAAQKAIDDFEYNEKLKEDIEEDARVRKAEKRNRDLDKAKKDKEDSDAAIVEAEGKSIDAMKGLSDAFFAFKMKGAKGNAAEELKIRKQMFQVDKAFNIARAIQDGIRSVQAALTTPFPGGQILAGVNAAIAVANVAKIAATTFDGGGSSATPSIGGGGLGAGASFSQAAPNIAPPQNTTQLNSNGTVAQAPIKAYVVESESAAVTKRVIKLENQSKI